MKPIWPTLAPVYPYYLAGSGKNRVNLIENIATHSGIPASMWVSEPLNPDLGSLTWNGTLNWDGATKWDGTGSGRDKFSVGKNTRWDLNRVTTDTGSRTSGSKTVTTNVNVDGNAGSGAARKTVVKETTYFNKPDINPRWIDTSVGSRMRLNGGNTDIDNSLISTKRTTNTMAAGSLGTEGIGGSKTTITKTTTTVNKNTDNPGNLNGGYIDFSNTINNINDKTYVEKTTERRVNEVVNKDISSSTTTGGRNTVETVSTFDSSITDPFVMEGGVSTTVTERSPNGVSKITKTYRNPNGNIIKTITTITIINETKIISSDEFGGGSSSATQTTDRVFDTSTNNIRVTSTDRAGSLTLEKSPRTVDISKATKDVTIERTNMDRILPSTITETRTVSTETNRQGTLTTDTVSSGNRQIDNILRESHSSTNFDGSSVDILLNGNTQPDFREKIRVSEVPVVRGDTLTQTIKTTNTDPTLDINTSLSGDTRTSTDTLRTNEFIETGTTKVDISRDSGTTSIGIPTVDMSGSSTTDSRFQPTNQNIVTETITETVVTGDRPRTQTTETITTRADTTGSSSSTDFVFIPTNERTETKTVVTSSKDASSQSSNMFGVSGSDPSGMKKISTSKVGDVVITESIGPGGQKLITRETIIRETFAGGVEPHTITISDAHSSGVTSETIFGGREINRRPTSTNMFGGTNVDSRRFSDTTQDASVNVFNTRSTDSGTVVDTSTSSSNQYVLPESGGTSRGQSVTIRNITVIDYTKDRSRPDLKETINYESSGTQGSRSSASTTLFAGSTDGIPIMIDYGPSTTVEETVRTVNVEPPPMIIPKETVETVRTRNDNIDYRPIDVQPVVVETITETIADNRPAKKVVETVTERVDQGRTGVDSSITSTSTSSSMTSTSSSSSVSSNVDTNLYDTVDTITTDGLPFDVLIVKPGRSVTEVQSNYSDTGGVVTNDIGAVEGTGVQTVTVVEEIVSTNSRPDTEIIRETRPTVTTTGREVGTSRGVGSTLTITNRNELGTSRDVESTIVVTGQDNRGIDVGGTVIGKSRDRDASVTITRQDNVVTDPLVDAAVSNQGVDFSVIGTGTTGNVIGTSRDRGATVTIIKEETIVTDPSLEMSSSNQGRDISMTVTNEGLSGSVTGTSRDRDASVTIVGEGNTVVDPALDFSGSSQNRDVFVTVTDQGLTESAIVGTSRDRDATVTITGTTEPALEITGSNQNSEASVLTDNTQGVDASFVGKSSDKDASVTIIRPENTFPDPTLSSITEETFTVIGNENLNNVDGNVDSSNLMTRSDGASIDTSRTVDQSASITSDIGTLSGNRNVGSSVSLDAGAGSISITESKSKDTTIGIDSTGGSSISVSNNVDGNVDFNRQDGRTETVVTVTNTTTVNTDTRAPEVSETTTATESVVNPKISKKTVVIPEEITVTREIINTTDTTQDILPAGKTIIRETIITETFVTDGKGGLTPVKVVDGSQSALTTSDFTDVNTGGAFETSVTGSSSSSFQTSSSTLETSGSTITDSLLPVVDSANIADVFPSETVDFGPNVDPVVVPLPTEQIDFSESISGSQSVTGQNSLSETSITGDPSLQNSSWTNYTTIRGPQGDSTIIIEETVIIENITTPTAGEISTTGAVNTYNETTSSVSSNSKNDFRTVETSFTLDANGVTRDSSSGNVVSENVIATTGEPAVGTESNVAMTEGSSSTMTNSNPGFDLIFLNTETSPPKPRQQVEEIITTVTEEIITGHGETIKPQTKTTVQKDGSVVTEVVEIIESNAGGGASSTTSENSSFQSSQSSSSSSSGINIIKPRQPGRIVSGPSGVSGSLDIASGDLAGGSSLSLTPPGMNRQNSAILFFIEPGVTSDSTATVSSTQVGAKTPVITETDSTISRRKESFNLRNVDTNIQGSDGFIERPGTEIVTTETRVEKASSSSVGDVSGGFGETSINADGSVGKSMSSGTTLVETVSGTGSADTSNANSVTFDTEVGSGSPLSSTDSILGREIGSVTTSQSVSSTSPVRTTMGLSNPVLFNSERMAAKNTETTSKIPMDTSLNADVGLTTGETVRRRRAVGENRMVEQINSMLDVLTGYFKETHNKTANNIVQALTKIHKTRNNDPSMKLLNITVKTKLKTLPDSSSKIKKEAEILSKTSKFDVLGKKTMKRKSRKIKSRLSEQLPRTRKGNELDQAKERVPDSSRIIINEPQERVVIPSENVKTSLSRSVSPTASERVIEQIKQEIKIEKRNELRKLETANKVKQISKVQKGQQTEAMQTRTDSMNNVSINEIKLKKPETTPEPISIDTTYVYEFVTQEPITEIIFPETTKRKTTSTTTTTTTTTTTPAPLPPPKPVPTSPLDKARVIFSQNGQSRRQRRPPRERKQTLSENISQRLATSEDLSRVKTAGLLSNSIPHSDVSGGFVLSRVEDQQQMGMSRVSDVINNNHGNNQRMSDISRVSDFSGNQRNSHGTAMVHDMIHDQARGKITAKTV